MFLHCTSVLREADGQRAVGDLILEQVLLVEEQDDGRLCEPLVVADGVKQLHALVHPVLSGKGTKCGDKEIIRARQWHKKEMGFTGERKKTKKQTPSLYILITLGTVSHHLLILSQDQVVGAHGHTEDDGSDTLEAVDPLLPLGPLASHIKHPARRQTT